MNVKKTAGLVLSFLVLSSFLLGGEYSLEIKMRFYEGMREGRIEPPQFVTSSYLQPTVTATIPSKYLLAEEQDQIKKVFNLKDVNLISEADLRWSSRKGTVAHVFRLDGKHYLLHMSAVPREFQVQAGKEKKEPVHQLQIDIFEQIEKTQTPLFDTEIILPGKNIAVFGFEDKQGNPYFLSFHVVSAAGILPPQPPPPPAPPQPPSPQEVKRIKQKIKEFEEGAVRCVGDIKPPKLVDMVEPAYPEKARQAKVEGVVILGVRTDKKGQVYRAMVYRSKDPLLDQAALDAVKQWVYEPLIIDGEPREAIFTVTVRFKLNGKKEEKVGGVLGGALPIGDLGEPPQLIEKVPPVYPEEAKKAGVQGIVVLEAATDKDGNVVDVQVLKSESSLLNQAAVEALKQWKYEPYYKEGKPVPVSFTVTIKFKLK